jgi:hypothetical protein
MMTIYSLHDYLPLSDLGKILVVALVVAIIAPSAVSVAIVGLDRRRSGRLGIGNAMVGVGVGVLALLVAVGLLALIDRPA